MLKHLSFYIEFNPPTSIETASLDGGYNVETTPKTRTLQEKRCKKNCTAFFCWELR